MDKLKKLGKYLHTNYPTIKWYIETPEENVVVNFGDGFILTGTIDGSKKSFFILNEDKNPTIWADVIAAKLIGKEEEDAE